MCIIAMYVYAITRMNIHFTIQLMLWLKYLMITLHKIRWSVKHASKQTITPELL